MLIRLPTPNPYPAPQLSRSPTLSRRAPSWPRSQALHCPMQPSVLIPASLSALVPGRPRNPDPRSPYSRRDSHFRLRLALGLLTLAFPMNSFPSFPFMIVQCGSRLLIGRPVASELMDILRQVRGQVVTRGGPPFFKTPFLFTQSSLSLYNLLPSYTISFFFI
jgi:hypothetical protein